MKKSFSILCAIFLLTLNCLCSGSEFNNVVIGKQVYASGGNINDINDGLMYTRWGAGDSNQDHWIVINLGDKYEISRVVVFWETAYGSQYNIQTSTDSANWTTVFTETSGNGGKDDIFFPSAEIQYIKIVLQKRGTVYNYSIYEIEAYENLTKDDIPDDPHSGMRNLIYYNGFEHLSLGKYNKQTIGGLEWAWNDASVITDDDAFLGSQSLSGNSFGWGGGFNLLTDADIEANSLYEVHVTARSDEKGDHFEFWSNQILENIDYRQLASSNIGPGLLKFDSTLFTSIIFYHYTPNIVPLNKNVIQLEYSKHGPGGYIDEIKVYKIEDTTGARLSFKMELNDTKTAVGFHAKFFSYAIGPAPIKYQWYLNGVILPNDTTPALTINNVTQDMDGAKISLKAFNDHDTITSDEKTLTIVPLDELLLDKPILSSSVDTICHTSNYSVINVVNYSLAEDLSWDFIPESAVDKVNLYSNWLKISYKTDYIGEVKAVAYATNEYGNSEMSDPIIIERINCSLTSTNDLISQNPSVNQTGNRLIVGNCETVENIMIFDVMGNLLFQCSDEHTVTLPDGLKSKMIIFSIKSNDEVYTGKLFIREF